MSIECIEGVPVSVTGEDGGTVWQWGDPIADLEDMLCIPERDRAQDAPTETEATEPAATEREELEAARTVWMESTTTEGQQLDLIAYFGYGDASWQDLAAPAA